MPVRAEGPLHQGSSTRWPACRSHSRLRGMDEQLVREMVAAATQAPSVHNTQPWRFVASDDTVAVWADPSRRLPVLDPAGRALHVSCGAALALAEVYARSRGVGCTLRLLPDREQPDHLADIVFAGSGAVTDADLAAAIPARHTDRRPFDPRPVPAELTRALALAVEHEGCWLKVIEDVDDRATVAVTLARAEEGLAADPAYREELRAWTGRREDATDGLPAGVAAGPPPAARGSSFRLRDFDPDAGAPTTPAGDPPLAEHPLVVVLGTADDDAQSWLRAGRALGRLLLTATAAGLACSPMTQALELTDTRTRLTHDLGLLGHPQMVLRVGFPSGGQDSGWARRRPVEDVLTLH